MAMKDFYPTINGKRTHIRAASQRDLEQKILARRKLVEQLSEQTKTVSITAYAKEWLEKKKTAPEKKRIRFSTIAEYTRYIGYIERYFGSMPLEAVTTQKVQAFVDWMAQGSKNGFKTDLAEDTIMRTLGTLKQIMKYAVEVSEVIAKIPYKSSLIVNNGKPSSHHKAVAPEIYQQVKAMIPSLADPNECIFMALLITTGMRPEEIYGLRWEDISPDWTYLHIERAVTYPDKNLPHINLPKTEKSSRFVNLMGWVAEIMQAQKKTVGFVLGGEKPLCYATRSRMQRSAWKNTGLEGKRICPYDFRANFATMLCESGKSDKQVADLMGHTDTRMVDHIYAPARKEGILQHKDDCEKLFGL